MTTSTRFPQHTLETAPAESQPYLKASKEKLGFVPNVYAYLAETPVGMEAVSQLAKLFSRTTFTEAQRNLLLLTASVENSCRFCVAAHTFGATAGGVDPATITAIRSGEPVINAQDAALAGFVRCMIRERGQVPESELQKFLDSGFTPRQALEVTVGVALKVLTNYVNHLTHTEVNPQLHAHAWEPGSS